MSQTSRKQFRLPQEVLSEAKKLLKTKTETETVIKSLELAIRQKKLEAFAQLAGKLRFSLTQKKLEKMRSE